MKALTVMVMVLGVVFLFSLSADTAFAWGDDWGDDGHHWTYDGGHDWSWGDKGDCHRVPEPGTLVLLGAGLAGVIVARRRMK